MKKINLSDAGPEISQAIYSFWRWKDEKEITQKELEEVVLYNLSLGVNSFLTSYAFGQGKVEELFGKLIDNKTIKRKDIVLFSKFGYQSKLDKNGNVDYKEFNEKYLLKNVEDSLKRLKTDFIDVFLIHEFDPLMNIEEIASALTTLKVSGKIRHVGVSDFNASQHRLLASQLSFDIVTSHFELNVLNTKALQDGRFDFVKEQYSKPMAWAPLKNGRIISGNETKEIVVRNALSQLAEKYNSNVEQLAVAWLHKLGALPIIGSRDKNRIFNAASAADIKLSYADWQFIYNVSKINS
jgi:predicted oxidoreductase